MEIINYDFKGGLPQEFEIVNISELLAQNRESLTRIHRADFYHIIWFQKGRAKHLVDFIEIDIEPNTLVFLKKGLVQRFDADRPFEAVAILFTDAFYCATPRDFEFLNHNLLFNDLSGAVHFTVEHAESLANTLQNLRLELQQPKDELQHSILKNQLHNFLLYAERERGKQLPNTVKPSVDLDYVMHFRQLLDREFTANKRVQFYARECSISQKRLNTATWRILGKNPKQLIDARVVLEAKRLLAHTRDSIKEIAYELGFEEPTNFIKYFKKHSGQTPVEFRGQYRQT